MLYACIQWRMFLVIIIFVLYFNVINSFTIVKSLNGTTDQTFLLINGWAKEITDVETIKTLNFDPNNLVTVSWDVIRSLRLGDKVPLIKYENGSPDEIMRVELLKINSLQPQVLYDVQVIGEYINPAVVKFRGRLLLAAGIEWGFAGLNHKSATGNVEFAWLNTTEVPFYSPAMYHGINMDVNSLLVFPFAGQDPRMVVINDNKIAISYTSMGHRIRMGVAELIISSDEETKYFSGGSRRRRLRNQPDKHRRTADDVDGVVNATIHNVFRFITPPPGTNPNDDEKNWAPFVYNNSMHYIHRVNPLNVVTTKHYDDDPYNDLFAENVSEAEKAPLNWKYGEIRGGTNAILVKTYNSHRGEFEEVYLALFHSNSVLNGNILRTYWMGGFTFTAKPPFRILTYTEYPLVHNSLYDGAWSTIKNRHIDYVPFPSTIYLEGEVVHLSLGWQDKYGCIAKMNLRKLLDAMVPV